MPGRTRAARRSWRLRWIRWSACWRSNSSIPGRPRSTRHSRTRRCSTSVIRAIRDERSRHLLRRSRIRRCTRPHAVHAAGKRRGCRTAQHDDQWLRRHGWLDRDLLPVRAARRGQQGPRRCGRQQPLFRDGYAAPHRRAAGIDRQLGRGEQPGARHHPGPAAPQAQGLHPRPHDRRRAEGLGHLPHDELAADGAQHGLAQSEWPDFRLLVDPVDFLLPQVWSPGDPRWFDASKGARVAQLSQ